MGGTKRGLLVGVLLISSMLIYGCSGVSGGTVAGDHDSFAQCLSEKGAVMYGAYWCSHCKNQKEMFGSSFEFVNYVECTEEELKCTSDGIEGYPTWIINGRKYPGEQSLSSLSSLTGCEL